MLIITSAYELRGSEGGLLVHIDKRKIANRRLQAVTSQAKPEQDNLIHILHTSTALMEHELGYSCPNPTVSLQMCVVRMTV